MKKIALWALLVLCLAAAVQSQERTPKVLLRAAQCLAAKKFLPASKARKLTLGYVLDKKSYPGRKVVYVVEHAGPDRSSGQVFAVFLTERDGRQVFSIQNNASFVLSKREPGGVSFVTPPLGGTWTHEHLASAIEEAENRPRFTIPVKDLSLVGESIACEAYTDPERQRGRK